MLYRIHQIGMYSEILTANCVLLNHIALSQCDRYLVNFNGSTRILYPMNAEGRSRHTQAHNGHIIYNKLWIIKTHFSQYVSINIVCISYFITRFYDGDVQRRSGQNIGLTFDTTGIRILSTKHYYLVVWYF